MECNYLYPSLKIDLCELKEACKQAFGQYTYTHTSNSGRKKRIKNDGKKLEREKKNQQQYSFA